MIQKLISKYAVKRLCIQSAIDYYNQLGEHHIDETSILKVDLQKNEDFLCDLKRAL